MRSLRARVILGISLIALLPLAVTTFVLSRRIESMVEMQGDERLTSALHSLERRLQFDGAEMEDKLRLLARDPVLRRLYLVPQGGERELSDYLAERRMLLRLDVLEVADTTGKVLAREYRGDRISDLLVTRDAPIEYERDTVGLLSGCLYIDREFLEQQKESNGVDLTLFGSDGKAIASTFADTTLLFHPVNATIARVSMDGHSFLACDEPLDPNAPIPTTLSVIEPFPRIGLYLSTAPSDRAIVTLKLTSLALAIVGLSIAILLGTLWSSQISRPVEQLADFSRKVAEGHWEEPLQIHSVRELETLVTALDRMRQDLKGYRERLVVSERHAAWSQMARKVAHEVKNPLTPIAISVADLKRSYEQKRPEFPTILDQAVKTIGEEVERLKRMLQEFSEFGRLPAPQFEPCRLGDLFTDLSALYTKDVQDKKLFLELHNPDTTFTADRSQLRQALVNLLQNGLEAVNGSGRVILKAQAEPHDIRISVADDGPGLTQEQSALLFSPGFTTKKTGSGLGLVMVERIVSDHHGSIEVDTRPGQGTTFTMRIPRTIQT